MRLAFVSPEALDPRARELRSSPTSGGYLYDARVSAELHRLGHEVAEIATPRAGASVEALASLLAGYDGVLEDELGFELYTRVNARLKAIAPAVPIVALVHVPTALLSPSDEVAARERAFLGGIDGSIFVSRATLDDTTALLGAHGPSFVAEPGWDHFEDARAAHLPGSFHVVSVGHLLPSKGLLDLVTVFEAFAARIGEAPWAASLIGDDAIDDAHARAVRERLAASPVGKNVRLLGRCSQARVAEVFSDAHVFVTGARYESYGIATAEALSVGLPVVGWARGGFQQLVGESGNGVVVPQDDVAGFARAIDDLRRDEGLVRMRAQRARAARASLPTWARAAERIASAFASLGLPARASGASEDDDAVG